MSKTGANAFMPRKKPCMIIAIVTFIIFLASIISLIVIEANLIKSDRIYPPKKSSFTSVMADGEDWFYTTHDSIYRMDEDDDKKGSYDLLQHATDAGYDPEKIGKLRTLYSEASTKYMYAITNRGLVFQLEKFQTEEDQEFKVHSMVQLPGELCGIIERNGELYVIVDIGGDRFIYKYDANNLTDEFLAGGHLFKVSWRKASLDGTTPARYKLDKLKQMSILSFDVVVENGETYVYIMYEDGLLRMHSDFQMNTFWSKLDAETESIYRDLEAQEKANQGLNPEDSLSAEKVAELQADAETAARAKLGIIESDDLSITVQAGEGDTYFDESQYTRYKVGTTSFEGCAFVEDKATYYMVTSDGKMVSFNLDSLAGMSMENNRDTLKLETEKGMKLKGTPQKMANGVALHYNKDLKIGFLLYDASNKVSRINFDTEEVEFTKAVEFKISSIIQAADESRFYYMYTNHVEAESGQYILRVMPLGGEALDAKLRTAKTVLIITSIIIALVCLVAALCTWKKGFDWKFAQTIYGIKRHWMIYVILAGCLTLLGMCCYYPAIGSVMLSFFDYSENDPSRRWNNFYNYKQVFRSSDFKQQCFNMVLFLGVDLLVALLPPLIFAFFLTIMRNRNYSATMRTLLFIPGVIPGVATALVWKQGIYGTDGVLNLIYELLTGKAINRDFLNYTRWTNLTSMMMMGFPFVGSYLIFYGAMMNVPSSYYEAAELDGITTRKRFFYIDVPLIFAQIKYVIVMSTISSVQNFGRIHTTTQGINGTRTPIYEMYTLIQEHGEYGRGAAYATVLFILLFILTIINMRMQGKDKEA